MMKKRMLNYILKGMLVVALPLFLTSCGAFYMSGYDDGIYGESSVRYTYERPQYERYEPKNAPQSNYKAYLQQKANDYKDFNSQLQPTYTPFADVNNYHTPMNQNPQQGYNSYASWGSNSKEAQVTVYNNYGGWGYDPYWNYHNTYYWGSSAWYPYGYYDYYYPYRSGWSLHIGSYRPYWNLGWGYGYRGYSPYYYDYYSPYHYPYYRDRYYYDRWDYYPRKIYKNDGYYYDYGRNNNSYDNDRRRYDERRYDNSRYNKSYENNNSRIYDNSRRYTGDYNNNSSEPQPYYRNTSPSYNNNSNSSRSYDSGRYSTPSSSSSSRSNTGSSRGTTQRDY